MVKTELRIKELCREMGMSQKDLAKQMRISEVALCRMLKRGRPNFEALERLAGALGVDIPDLFEQSHTRLVCPHCGQIIHLDAK